MGNGIALLFISTSSCTRLSIKSTLSASSAQMPTQPSNVGAFEIADPKAPLPYHLRIQMSMHWDFQPTSPLFPELHFLSAK